MIWRISAALILLAQPLSAASCQNVSFQDNPYTVCQVDLRANEARLFWRDEDGALYGGFDTLPADVLIATNGGMYHEDRRPVGHYREAGEDVVAPVVGAGPGNFGLTPNGVLCLMEGRAEILETERYVAAAPPCRHATQSGPMLVIDGALHPRFFAESQSRKRRGGVGVSADGRTLFIAITRAPVNFHAFATLFRDGLGTPNALFTDGTITRLYDRAAGRADSGARMGPILAIMD
ncbi:MAG: phosphodiester glycosidase family protein [Pseudomonadota bacterium]